MENKNDDDASWSGLKDDLVQLFQAVTYKADWAGIRDDLVEICQAVRCEVRDDLHYLGKVVKEKFRTTAPKP